MYKRKKILALIPARGGSKGIKLKNLVRIKKKTLIEHAIDCLRKTKIVDEIVISTDHKKIKQHVRKIKDIKILHRPKKISGDRISDLIVIKHLLKSHNCDKFNIILMIQPTSVLRKPSHVKSSIKLMLKNDFNSVWSVSEVTLKHHPLKQLTIQSNRLKYFDSKGKNIIARQQLAKTFIRNGAVYCFKKNYLIKATNLLSSNCGYLIIDEKQISIDNLSDIRVAKKFL